MLNVDVEKAFIRAGIPLYKVGGCVRDEVMKRDFDDVDYSTPASLVDVVENVHVPDATLTTIGAAYEIAAFFRGEEKVDVARFRKEHAHTEDRKDFSFEHVQSIEEDLARRDFTVNAMAVDVFTGKTVDPFEGLLDIARRRLRAVGVARERFLEDALRVMRFFRFLATLQFRSDKSTLEACADPDVLERLHMVSGERKRDELFKLLKAQDRYAVTNSLRLMQKAGVLQVVLPEVSALENLPYHKNYHSVNPFEHTMLSLEAYEGNDFVVRLSLLLHDVGKALTVTDEGYSPKHSVVGAELVNQVAERLRFTNSLRDEVAFLVATHMDRLEGGPLVKKLKRATKSSTLERSFAVKRADVMGRGEKARREVAANLDALYMELKELQDSKPPMNVKDLAVSGKDLMEVGVEAGPRMGKLLKNMLEEVLNGYPNEKDALLRLV